MDLAGSEKGRYPTCSLVSSPDGNKIRRKID